MRPELVHGGVPLVGAFLERLVRLTGLEPELGPRNEVGDLAAESRPRDNVVATGQHECRHRDLMEPVAGVVGVQVCSCWRKAAGLCGCGKAIVSSMI